VSCSGTSSPLKILANSRRNLYPGFFSVTSSSFFNATAATGPGDFFREVNTFSTILIESVKGNPFFPIE
jgi:hypothetical protein